MNAYLESRYDVARDEYLRQVAYMHQQIEKFAEERGGVEALNDADTRSYQGRLGRVIALAQFNDATREYIESLQEWIGELIQTNRQLAQQAPRPFWEEIHPTAAGGSETERRRDISISRARVTWSDLY